MAWPIASSGWKTQHLWSHEGRWILSFGGRAAEQDVGREKTRPQFLIAECVEKQPSNYCYALYRIDQPARSEDIASHEVPSGKLHQEGAAAQHERH